MEWVSHKYIMHGTGPLGSIFKRCGIADSHIKHHLQTSLSQSLIGEVDHDSLIFSPKEQVLLFVTGLFFASLIWILLRKPFHYAFVFGSVLMLSIFHSWLWASFHTSYHHISPEDNELLVMSNGEKRTIFTVFDIQNTRSICYDQNNLWCKYYRYLAWYHALHHLKKGEKQNYNIIFPLADYLFGSYVNVVDNREYFAKNYPNNKQEEWLSRHLVFEIKIDKGNGILYRSLDGHSSQWHILPSEY